MNYYRIGDERTVICPTKHATPTHEAGVIREDGEKVFFETGSEFAYLTASDLREIADEMEKK